MKIRVICGDEACRNEFSADTGEAEWTCPQCERVIENPHFPFLTARVMQSRFRPDDVDWEEMFQRLAEDVQVYFTTRMYMIYPDVHELLKGRMTDDQVTLARISEAGAGDLKDRYSGRFDGDFRKMHDALLEEAQSLARTVRPAELEVSRTGDGGPPRESAPAGGRDAAEGGSGAEGGSSGADDGRSGTDEEAGGEDSSGGEAKGPSGESGED